MTEDDDILSDTFHLCALRAYLEIAVATKQFPPDAEATRRRAYELYEAALAEKNRRRPPPDNRGSLPRESGPGCEAAEGSGASFVEIVWMPSENRLNKTAKPVRGT